MAIKVAKLENLFWSNGSWEKPNTIPDISDFTNFPDLQVDWNDNKTLGLVILSGDWNYAYCEDQWYFLNRVKVADRDGVWFYGLIKDWWVNWLSKEISFKGFCTRTSNKKLLLDNINFVEPIIQNPCKQYRLNLDGHLSVNWYEDIVINKPKIQPENFRSNTITLQEWYTFLKDCEDIPVADIDLSKVKDNKGVVIVAKLEPKIEQSIWKKKIYEKLLWLLDNLELYSLSKISGEGGGLGIRSSVRDHYVLTLTSEGGLGNFEESAKVTKLDFHNLKDIAFANELSGDGTERLQDFAKLNLNIDELSRTYSVLPSEPHKYWALQRKVYFPYLRKNWSTNNDFLYRGHFDSITYSSSVREQPISNIREFVEEEPLTIAYQGSFAQGLKSKTDNKSYWLPWTYQLDTAINITNRAKKISQLSSNLGGHIPYLTEKNPPEFGLLLFDFIRDRKYWCWWHYLGNTKYDIDILVGLKHNWQNPTTATYDRDVKPWVDRVKVWWTNFQLINSLYPYGWLYYFTVLQDNKLKISYHDWKDWGGTSGFFSVSPNKEGELDLSKLDFKQLISRDIDSNTLDINYLDKVRTNFINNSAITNKVYLPFTIEKDDIFFSDLNAFWVEYTRKEQDYKYDLESDWYFNFKKLYPKAIFNTDKSPLILYWNNNTKKYHLGIYSTFEFEEQLSKEEEQDIIGVKFKDSNSGTNIVSTDDVISKKTIKYHHIQQIRNEASLSPQKAWSKQAFFSWAKTPSGLKILSELEILFNRYREYCDYMSRGFLGVRSDPFTSKFKKMLGVTGNPIMKIPKVGNEYDLTKLFEMINRNDKFLTSDSYGEALYSSEMYSYDTLFAQASPVVQFSRAVFANRTKLYDYIKFGDGSWMCDHTLDGTVIKIKNLINKAILNLYDSDAFLGETYTFSNIQEFKTKINQVGIQRDIYKSLGLIDSNNRYIGNVEDIKEKLFDLIGTGYYLYIDINNYPHLIFKPQTQKNSIQFKELATYRLSEEEVPEQDFIDAINQQTSVQVVTTTYPLAERLLFKQEDYLPSTEFKIEILKYSIDNKVNPNDYYIISYQGARQLIDSRLAIPKKTLSKTRIADAWTRATLAFEREKWREDYRSREALNKVTFERRFKEFEFNKQLLALEREQFAIDSLRDIGRGIISASEYGGNVLLGKLDPVQTSLTPWKIGVEGIHTFGSRLIQQSQLNIKGEKIQADILQALAQKEIQLNLLHNEHHFNERHYALQLASTGNIYQQGEVTDRDINELYNQELGLNEIHLIYRVPSDVQKEGLTRYYELYGSACQIPDVTFKFNTVLREGDIWQFGYIDEVTNLWAGEEKEALKALFQNGVKILSFRKVQKAPLALPIKAWVEKADEVLKEASPQQKTILFNKLSTQLDTVNILRTLVENTVDKNTLIEVLSKYIAKESVLDSILKGDKEELTQIIFKLIKKANEDAIFKSLLTNKDKERLIEEWIEQGSKLDRVLWDKYPDKVVSKERHEEVISQKDGTIDDYRLELQNLHKDALKVDSQLSSTKQVLANTQLNVNRQKDTITRLQQENKDKDSSIQVITAQKTRLETDKKALSAEIEKIKQEKKESEALQAKELLKVQSNLQEKQKELEAQKLQIDKQLQQIKEQEETIKALREIEAAKPTVDEARWSAVAVSSVFFSGRWQYIYFVPDGGSTFDLYEWDKDYCIFYLGRAQQRITLKKGWSSTSGYWQQSYDEGFFAIFHQDEFVNTRIKEYWNSGRMTDIKYSFNTNQYFDDGAYGSTYVGSWRVLPETHAESWQKYPKIRNKIGSSSKTIDNLELETPLYWNAEERKFQAKEIEGIKKLTLYKEYLDFLGLKWDESKKKAVPKSLLN